MAKRSVDSTPKRSRTRVRHQLQLSFQSATAKESFLSRIERSKRRLFPEVAPGQEKDLEDDPDGDMEEEHECSDAQEVFDE